MQTDTRLTYLKWAFRWVPATLLAVGLGACSSSTSTPGSTANVNAARVSIGSITGFGSVHVNGVKFETTSAKITVNGQAAMQTDLKVGDVVAVHGHHDDSSGQDMADSIEFHDNVQGPVSMIAMTAGPAVVPGPHVIASPDPSFGNILMPAPLSAM